MSIRNPWDIPRKFKDKICSCKNWTAEISKGRLRCGRCHLVFGHQFYRCAECDTYFICDFKWPYFCVWHPTCWDCSQDHTSICTEKHGWPIKEEYLNMEIATPLGFNPKAFTAEELASVFDFD